MCVHENRGPYDCSVCQRACIRRNDLESHLQREHKQCAHCSSWFDSPERHDEHVRRVHPKENQVVVSNYYLQENPSVDQLLQKVIDSGFFEQNFV